MSQIILLASPPELGACTGETPALIQVPLRACPILPLTQTSFSLRFSGRRAQTDTQESPEPATACSATPSTRLGVLLPFPGDSELVIVIEGVDRRDGWVGPSS